VLCWDLINRKVIKHEICKQWDYRHQVTTRTVCLSSHTFWMQDTRDYIKLPATIKIWHSHMTHSFWRSALHTFTTRCSLFTPHRTWFSLYFKLEAILMKKKYLNLPVAKCAFTRFIQQSISVFSVLQQWNVIGIFYIQNYIYCTYFMNGDICNRSYAFLTLWLSISSTSPSH
jgi:hypothetical protein